MDAAEVEAIAAAATAFINGVVQASPAIIKGVTSAEPFVEALVGLLTGSNVTQDQLDASVAQVQALSAEFQEPMPEDGAASS